MGRERLRRAMQAIADGRTPGVNGRPRLAPAEATDAGAAADEVIQQIVQELVPNRLDDIDGLLDAITALIEQREPKDNSATYRECIYRSLEGAPIDGEAAQLVDSAIAAWRQTVGDVSGAPVKVMEGPDLS